MSSLQETACKSTKAANSFSTTLGEYVDGTLSEELCAELERHMKDCQRCRVVVNTLKKDC